MQIAIRTPGEVGATIKARRRELGWDQATLAAKIGVSRLWVNQIERGKPGASLGLVLNALNTLGLTITIPATGVEDGATPHQKEINEASMFELTDAFGVPLFSSKETISAILEASRRKPVS